MKNIIQRFSIFCAICLVASACSHNGENTGSSGKPQFRITPKDLLSFAEVTTNRMSSGSNMTFAIHLRFTDAKAAELRKFTQEHINQQVQLLVGSNVIAEPFIAVEISNRLVDLSFASPDEAHAVANLLAPTFYENYGFNKLDMHGKAKILVNP